MNATKLQKLADDLGRIKAEMAVLKEAEASVRQQLIDAGVREVEGDLFRALVVDSDRKIIDWRAIAEKLKPSRQLIAGNTRIQHTTSVRVSARKGVTS